MSIRASDTNPDPNNDPDFLNYLDTNAPPEFLCPITMSLMKDPVLMPDGQTYEREAIRMALRVNPVSPVTRQPMNIDQAITNYALKNLIEKYIEDKKAQQVPPPQPPQQPSTTTPSHENLQTNENPHNDENQRFNRNLRELTAMGFGEQASRDALNRTQNDLQKATTLLVNNRKKNSERNRAFADDNSHRNSRVSYDENSNQAPKQKKEILFFIIAILVCILIILFC